MSHKKYLLGFSLLSEIGPSRFKKIQAHFPSLEQAWNNSNKKDFLAAGIDEKTADKLVAHRPATNIERELEKIQKENIAIISYDDESYPPQLREISSAPFILFCRGNTSLLKNNQLAVIGTRRPSYYGKQVAGKILPDICRAGLIITSGMAQGIDTAAHQIALKNNAATIAVLGSGINDRLLEKSSSPSLAKQIIYEGGLILSEYPPDFSANKFTFPARNRIISGLSLGTIVLEAGWKSGSLITAKYALDQNREVFAVPGNIFSPQSTGTNFLIKQGAKAVTSVTDILETLNIQFEPIKTAADSSSDVQEQKILHLLSFEPVSIDQLSLASRLPVAELLPQMSLLELKGLVSQIPGKGFIKN